MARKCTKSSNARAKLLFCLLNLLFRDVLVAVAAEVCLKVKCAFEPSGPSSRFIPNFYFLFAEKSNKKIINCFNAFGCLVIVARYALIMHNFKLMWL